MPVRMMRSHLCSTSFLAGACLLGAVLLVSGCASQQAAAATPTDVAFPTYPVVTPYPTVTAIVPPTPTPNATTATATAEGCRTPSGYQYFENPPGPLQTTIPFPPGTLVLNQGMGYAGDGAVYYFCTPGATHASITTYLASALPAAGWTTNSPHCAAHFPPGLWYKGNYAIQIDFYDSSLPGWALDIMHLGPMGC